MSDERPSRLADLPHVMRQRMTTLPDDAREWRQRLSEDPMAILHSPLVRVVLAVAALLLIVLGVSWLVGGLAPGNAGRFEEATPTATVHVACADPACGATYSTQVSLEFADWPLVCEKCGQPTVCRAKRCPTCGGWVANPPGQTVKCPHCTRKAKPKPTEAPAKPKLGDDEEDPW